MLELKKKYGSSLIAAQVIAQTPFDWERKIKIDKGEHDGLQDAGVVLDYYGRLAGVIESIDKKESWVTLVSDSDFKLSILCHDEPYLLTGFSSQFARLLYVPYDAEIAIDDEVFLGEASVSFS